MQNNFTKATQKQKHLDANKAADIDSDHDELVDKNVQPNHSSVEAEVIYNSYYEFFFIAFAFFT